MGTFGPLLSGVITEASSDFLKVEIKGTQHKIYYFSSPRVHESVESSTVSVVQPAPLSGSRRISPPHKETSSPWAVTPQPHPHPTPTVSFLSLDSVDLSVPDPCAQQGVSESPPCCSARRCFADGHRTRSRADACAQVPCACASEGRRCIIWRLWVESFEELPNAFVQLLNHFYVLTGNAGGSSSTSLPTLVHFWLFEDSHPLSVKRKLCLTD